LPTPAADRGDSRKRIRGTSLSDFECEENVMSNETTSAERRVRAGQTIRVIVWLVVVAVVVVFALVNTKKVDVDWVVSDSRAPLWVVIGASAVAGAIIGFVARPRRS